MSETTERPEGYAALPARFRRYVEALEARVSTLLASRPTAERTGVRVVNYARDGGDLGYLPDGSRIEFAVGKAEFDVYVKGGGLQVASSTGRLVILPEVSNVVTLLSRDISDDEALR